MKELGKEFIVSDLSWGTAEFIAAMETAQLLELPSIGGDFTRSNKSIGGNFTESKLDRTFTNMKWIDV